jgi:DNA-binding NarL/FixJ family response regulator
VSHTATISVVLADDHAMVRHALAQILQESGCLRVVGQAANGTETLDTVAKHRPEVLVLDYTMPDLDTPHAIELLLRRCPA